MEKKCTFGLLVVITAVIGMGCATTSSTRAKPLGIATGGNVDLSKYQIASVVPFEVAQGKKIDKSVGAKFSDEIATRLENDFGPLFREVRRGTPLGKEEELIVTGTIKTYRPGNRFARFMLIGLGPAGFEGELVVKDGADNRVLLTAPFDKLWAWGEGSWE